MSRTLKAGVSKTASSSDELVAAERELAGLNKELAWEMSKAAVDVAGLVDPTPISDGVGMAMSLAEGDLVGAGLSLISMVPYAGDALGKTAKGARAAKKLNDLRKKIAATTALVEKLKAPAKSASKKVDDALAKAKNVPAKKPAPAAPCPKPKPTPKPKPKARPKSPYRHLEDPPGVGKGKDFTKAQRKKIIEENKRLNGGTVKTDDPQADYFDKLTKPSKSKRGVTPRQDEWQIDHIIPKDKGGTNSYKNARVISRKLNREKSNK